MTETVYTTVLRQIVVLAPIEKAFAVFTQRVADYMSVHTFFTGVRGVLAPAVAFFAVQRLSMGMMAMFSAALIVAASLLLLPEIKFGRRARKAASLRRSGQLGIRGSGLSPRP